MGTVVVGKIPVEPVGYVERVERAGLVRRVADEQIVVCLGERGVGKSVLAGAVARAAIHDPVHEPRIRLVAWISGKSDFALITGLAAVARRVGLSREAQDDERQAARLARDYLSGLDETSLLVIDDAVNPDRVRRWLPGGRCRVLVTSTDPAFAYLADGVRLGRYSREESIDYLIERTGETDLAVADAVADALGDLPLALALAAAAIATRGLTYARYLDLLTTVGFTAELPDVLGPGYPRGLAEAIILGVRATVDADARTMIVLEAMSVLSSSEIGPAVLRRSLLHDRRPRRPWWRRRRPERVPVSAAEVEELVEVVANASLITLGVEGSSVVMHPLVATAIRASRPLGGLDAMLTDLVSGLTTLIADANVSPSASAHAEIAGWALALLELAVDPALPMPTVDSLIDTVTTVASWLYEVGAHAALADIDEQTAIALERIQAPDSPDALDTRHDLAVDHRAMGRFDEAIELDEQTLTARDRVLGSDHPDTLASRSNLAVGYWAVGRVDEAILLDEQTVIIRERVQGPEHADTLKTRSNLANCYWAAGRFDEAIRLDEQTLATVERVLGADHPQALVSRNNLVQGYRAVGRHDDADQLDARAFRSI